MSNRVTRKDVQQSLNRLAALVGTAAHGWELDHYPSSGGYRVVDGPSSPLDPRRRSAREMRDTLDFAHEAILATLRGKGYWI